MAVTYKKIASVTVGSGGAASMEFTSIPATYTDLIVKASARAVNDTATFYLGFNSSATNYTHREVYGGGASATSSNGTDYVFMVLNRSSYTASTFGNAEIYVPNYAGSTNKSVSVDSVTENNATASFTVLTAGLWSNTNAITSIQLFASSGNIAEHSTATLYGISNS